MLSKAEKELVRQYLEDKGLPLKKAVTFDDVTLKEHYSTIRSRREINDFRTKLTPNLTLNIPIVSSNMECVTGKWMMVAMAREGGLGFLPQSLPITDRLKILEEVKKFDTSILKFRERNPNALMDNDGSLIRTGTVGVGEKFSKRHILEVENQMKKGIRVLLIDTARAYSINMKEAIEKVLKLIKKEFPVDIIAGNISTAEGAKFLIDCGADVVKVGQGPGAACRTREVGIGVPQLTAIAECSAIAYAYDKTVVADGGIKSPGDISKALAAGASAVMIGKLLAGTNESPAPVENINGKLCKKYFGSASWEAQIFQKKRGMLNRVRRPEGVTMYVPKSGLVYEVIDDLLDGLRSAMSYVGARTILHLNEKAHVFVMQTRNGYIEGVKETV